MDIRRFISCKVNKFLVLQTSHLAQIILCRIVSLCDPRDYTGGPSHLEMSHLTVIMTDSLRGIRLDP